MSATPLYGQIPIVASATPLASIPVFVKFWSLKAPLSNKNPIFIGDANVTTANGHQLDPGDQIDYEVRFFQGEPFYPLQPSDLFVCGTPAVGDKATWLASP